MPKFIHRDRKQHKVRKDHGTTNLESSADDSNVTLLQPSAKTEHEANRQRLKAELRSQHTTISSKKQKRLDKYIETKLRKEEGLDLLKKLALSKIDTSAFVSSSRLGQKPSQAQLRSEEAERRDISQEDTSETDDEKNGVSANGAQYGLPSRSRLPSTKIPSLSGNERETLEPARKRDARNGDHVQSHQTTSEQVTLHNTARVSGSGLKRPLDYDEGGRPILKKRKMRNIISSRHAPDNTELLDESASDYSSGDTSLTGASSDDNDSDSSWDGFDIVAAPQADIATQTGPSPKRPRGE